MKQSNTPDVEKLLLFAAVLLMIYLALKSLKQFLYLSFTLLSLKIVWLFLIVLVFLNFAKKR